MILTLSFLVTGSKESAPEGPEEDSLDFEVDI
jgi:hypothetical protein